MTTTTERVHQGFPKTLIASPFNGDVEVWATSEKHIGLSANGPRNTEDRQTIFVNGVEYTVRFDFGPTAEVLEGSRPWDARDAAAAGLAWAVSYTSMTRVDNWKDASDAARRKVRAWALNWVNEFAVTEEGQALLNAARKGKVNNDLKAAEADLREARAKVEEIEARICALLDEEADLV